MSTRIPEKISPSLAHVTERKVFAPLNHHSLPSLARTGGLGTLESLRPSCVRGVPGNLTSLLWGQLFHASFGARFSATPSKFHC